MILKDLDTFTGSEPFELAGRRAEEQMAFYLKRMFGSEPDVFVLNGLRLEHGDDACQIDHLLVHRWGFVLVESKSVTTQVRVNARDEWSRLSAGIWKGMPSPVNQGNLQFELLRALLREAAPRLLGTILRMQKQFGGFQYEVFAAISDDGIVERATPEAHPRVLKADSVCAAIRVLLQEYRSASGVKGFAKGVFKPLSDPQYIAMLATEAEATARFLLDQHRPLTRKDAAQASPLQSDILVLPGQASKGALTCAACPKQLSAGVVEFCRGQSKRFGGKLYCMTCQRRH